MKNIYFVIIFKKMKKLDRKLSISAIIAISIAGMLGSVFILPGIAAAKTGLSIWLVFLVAALCVLPAVFSKSELATRKRQCCKSWFRWSYVS